MRHFLATNCIPNTLKQISKRLKSISMSPESITNWASTNDGQFRRQVSSFRCEISADPSAHHAASNNRYHLYVSKACPWAHRVMIVRQLKGLEDIIPMSVVHWNMGENGWAFSPHVDGVAGDPLFDAKYIRDLYFKAEKEYKGRFTVPIIWDKQKQTIVSNESSEIIRFLNTAFDLFLPKSLQGVTYYPEHLRKEIDEINEWVYNDINNGVYKTGFATTQSAYDENVKILFTALDKVETLLSDNRRYLVGGQLTEADIRLYTTAIRFDHVYQHHFKCTQGSIRHDYPLISRWMRRLYFSIPAFKDTVDFKHILNHYNYSHPQINPTRIIPLPPRPDIEPLLEQET